MFPLTVTINPDEYIDRFVEKELLDSRLKFHVLFKKLQHSRKVVFFFLIQSCELNQFHETNLKLILSNTISTQRQNILPNELKATQREIMNGKIQFRKNASFHYLFDCPDDSMTIILESISVKDNFNLVLTGLESNYPLPDKDNHDIKLICNRQGSQRLQPNDSSEISDDLSHNVLYAYKHILAYYSISFQQKFQAPYSNSSNQTKKSNVKNIVLDGYSIEVLQFIIEFMYTETVNPFYIVRNSSVFWMEVFNFIVDWKITAIQTLVLLICFSKILFTNA